MRPVQRGANHTVFAEYQEAKRDLIDRLGSYCSYCERLLPGGLAVEHILPYSNPEYSHLELNWENFLLSCINCNSHKKIIAKIVLDEYFWVHLDNTFLVLEYLSGGRIAVNPNLNEAQKQKATKTIAMFKLDLCPPEDLETRDPKARDLRWMQRKNVWELAQEERQELLTETSPSRRKATVEIAKSRGFWSIWMTVFKDDPDMLERLINAFAGTAKSCFDPVTFQPVPRVGGAI
jgi:uncharacterized protein (TIGR02646 family)